MVFENLVVTGFVAVLAFALGWLVGTNNLLSKFAERFGKFEVELQNLTSTVQGISPDKPPCSYISALEKKIVRIETVLKLEN